MRIVIFSNTYKPTISGVVTSINLFRQGLIKAGHDVHIFAPEYHDYVDEDPYIFRYPAVDFPKGLDLDLSLTLPVKQLLLLTLRGIKPDLIHSQHPYMMGKLALSLADELNVPLVFTFHTRYEEHVKSYLPLISDLAGIVVEEFIERYLKHCAHIIAPTASIRNFIQKTYKFNAPVTALSTPVDFSQYQSLNPQSIRTELNLTDAEILLYVGRLAPEKNLKFLLKAFAIIVKARPKSRLLLVGQGPYMDTLQQTAQKLKINQQVIFNGAVPAKKIPHFAAAADLFVFSSLTDTQGLVLTEAMAAGTPVVAVNAPGPTDVLAEGGGVLVSANETDFANAVIDLLKDNAHREALSQTALKTVQRFEITTATKHLLEIYKTVIDTKKKGN